MTEHSREYTEYLRSKEWQKRRQAKLESAKHRCQKCGEREGLEVHHKTYARLGNERSDDLIVLCRSCHFIADEYRKGNRDASKKFYAPHGKEIKFNARELSCIEMETRNRSIPEDKRGKRR